MKIIAISYLMFLMSFKLTYGQASDQNKNMSQFEFSASTANPKARALMNEEFYWSPIEESAPFGSDDGSDAAYGFIQWRASNKNSDPLAYLTELVRQWNYPPFAWNEMDAAKIKTYSMSFNKMGVHYLLGQDNAIVGICFAQLALEGHVSLGIKEAAIFALERQLLPMLIANYDSVYQTTRKSQLSKMLAAVKASQ